MKAVVVHKYGGPEVLKFEDYPDPVPGAGEVLVRVAAASVNPLDYKRRAGLTDDYYPIHFPGLIGVDMAGTVVKIGPEVEGFSVGDQVFSMADNTYAELCVVSAADGDAGILEIRQENARVHGRSRARWQAGHPDKRDPATQTSGRGSSNGRKRCRREDPASRLTLTHFTNRGPERKIGNEQRIAIINGQRTN
ncbi:MAG TPA: alcohol dehydrogenase catalytic domain-containing protein [Bryobacteraceae bacterium]|nr:alcohol dehydrogenase catalytic domain-containing protein [Bryobacteraceae bacterium]